MQDLDQEAAAMAQAERSVTSDISSLLRNTDQFAASFEEEANFCAGSSQIHTHSPTCVKYSIGRNRRNQDPCRFKALEARRKDRVHCGRFAANPPEPQPRESMEQGYCCRTSPQPRYIVRCHDVQDYGANLLRDKLRNQSGRSGVETRGGSSEGTRRPRQPSTEHSANTGGERRPKAPFR